MIQSSLDSHVLGVWPWQTAGVWGFVQESKTLDGLRIDSLDNIERSTLHNRTVSEVLESGNETLNLMSHASNKDELTPISEDDLDANFLAAAADQHKFTERASVNAGLCDLCRKCIGDIITGACFPESASQRSSRWTYEKTPMDYWWDKDLSFRHYEDIKSVEASALRHCTLCQLVSRGCWQSGSRQLYMTVTCLRRRTPFNVLIQDTTKELWMIYSWMQGSKSFQAFYPFVKKIHQRGTDLNQQEWYLGNTGSQKVMDTIRTWMSECLETHSLCAPQKPSSLPSRVIDVGQASSLDDPYLLKSGDRAAPYLALSYCWGTRKRLITTRDSIGRRREGFMLAELPETLRDAILVTRRLGVRYLWVDALCIVQDDDNDWLLESSKMRAVYSNALFVISALDASHSDSGMFHDRTALIASNDDISATSAGLYIREDPGPHNHLTPHGQNSLGERAWALQERFMATALLHFSRQRLFWECRTCSRYEGGLRRDNHPIRKGLGQSCDVNRSINEWVWYHLVNLFSKRKLTYTSDKLAAIAGLATEFEEQGWCQECIVGLWNSDLLRGLLWHTDPRALTEEPFAKRDINLRYPSWSWASSDRCPSWTLITSTAERARTHYDCDVQGMHFELSDASKTAIAVKGSITFTAFMISLTHDEVSSAVELWRFDQVFTGNKSRRPEMHGYLDVATEQPCWLARMATWKLNIGSRGLDTILKTVFLLFEEVCNQNVFRRVGIIEKSHDDSDDQLTIREMVCREITII